MKILTFDLEEWFHLLEVSGIEGPETWSGYSSRFEHNLNKIMGLLDSHDVKATFYCLGWIAEKYPNLIRELAENGHEIGCHSYAHTLAHKQTPAEFRSDLVKAIGLISSATGREVVSYRAPGFSVTNDNLWVYDILYEEGIRYDSSIFPGTRAHGGLNNFGVAEPCYLQTFNSNLIIEMPINTHSLLFCSFVFSGGGYFRLLPYSILHYLFSRKEYIMTYFHPRDFDPDQPVIANLSRLRYLKSYIGLSGSLDKLSRLLEEFEFVSVLGAAAEIDWKQVRVVNLADLKA